jgi:CyaY protein
MNYLAGSGIPFWGTGLMFGVAAGVDICGCGCCVDICGCGCCAGVVRAGASGSGGTRGMYSGPICPQPLNMPASIKALQIRMGRCKKNRGFTIRITVYINVLECSMTESEFLDLAEQALDSIESSLETEAETGDLDVECTRSGNVLQIECIDSKSKIIINSQAPMQEIWVAAKSGGFHYKYDGRIWRDTRDGSELFAVLSAIVSEQGGVTVTLSAR